MLNPGLYRWLEDLAKRSHFLECIALSDLNPVQRALERAKIFARSWLQAQYGVSGSGVDERDGLAAAYKQLERQFYSSVFQVPVVGLTLAATEALYLLWLGC